jgi:hypothetical protein
MKLREQKSWRSPTGRARSANCGRTACLFDRLFKAESGLSLTMSRERASYPELPPADVDSACRSSHSTFTGSVPTLMPRAVPTRCCEIGTTTSALSASRRQGSELDRFRVHLVIAQRPELPHGPGDRPGDGLGTPKARADPVVNDSTI